MSDSFNQKILNLTAAYDHVIWDWNGTLVDDVHLAVEAINVLLVEHDLPPTNISRYREMFGFPIRQYYLDLGFDFARKSFEELCERFVEEYDHRLAPTAQVFSGRRQLLTEIKCTKTQSILSAAAQWHLEIATQHLGVRHHFHHIYGVADHLGSSKIGRGRELLEATTIEAARTILIGDTCHDLEVAKELGLACVLIADGHQSFARLAERHDIVYEGGLAQFLQFSP